jgi:hypothetical protein
MMEKPGLTSPSFPKKLDEAKMFPLKLLLGFVFKGWARIHPALVMRLLTSIVFITRVYYEYI